MTLSRNEAEKRLYSLFGLRHFYDEQWKAIDALLQGHRILMIERTGFGKSLCYQFPATQFSGVTIVFSPLIALMRDQVASLRKMGIAARCINSGEDDDTNRQTLADAENGKIKILYIAPERQGNTMWQEALRTMKISMIVVDEAHCISQWGHDFRPSYRRIKNIVGKFLPASMPVLAVTATATRRVQHDIEGQLGGRLDVMRGNLMRNNFRLFVIRTHTENEKMIWLKRNLAKLQGTGIIYAGTHVQTELYTKWLAHIGIASTEYNASLDSDSRKNIEQGLKENRWKCIVSTNALGMGIDKADIRFIIHLQMPASPIHYYQEIGRAGRDGKPAELILFFNEMLGSDGVMQDCRLPLAFIDTSRPSERKYRQFIEAIKEKPMGEKEVALATNLKQNAVRTIKEDLIDMGIVREVLVGKSKKYEYQANAPKLDMSQFDQLNEAKKQDLNKMVEYVFTHEPRMKFLCQYLGDDTSVDYTDTCDNSGLPRKTIEYTDDDMATLKQFKENLFPVLEFKGKTNFITGVAASYYGDTSVGHAIHHCKYENGGDFPDFLVRLTLKAYYHTFGSKRHRFDMVLYVPPTESGNLVKNFAHKISHALDIPLCDALEKRRVTQSQKHYQNRYGKTENVKDAFKISANVKDKRILLIDDICDSGATLKAIGSLLTKQGAAEIAPLVIAKTVGGDKI